MDNVETFHFDTDDRIPGVSLLISANNTVVGFPSGRIDTKSISSMSGSAAAAGGPATRVRQCHPLLFPARSPEQGLSLNDNPDELERAARAADTARRNFFDHLQPEHVHRGRPIERKPAAKDEEMEKLREAHAGRIQRYKDLVL